VQYSKGTLALHQQEQRKKSIYFLLLLLAWDDTQLSTQLQGIQKTKHTKIKKKKILILPLEPRLLSQQILAVHSLIFNATILQRWLLL